MTEDKTQELKNKYPRIFSANFWFEHADGWFDLLDELCHKLQSYVDDFDSVEQVQAGQAKEKFGGLRFYLDQGGDDYVNRLIVEAEHKSYEICEICGAPGSVKKVGSWLMCRCQKCYDEEIEARNNRISQR